MKNNTYTGELYLEKMTCQIYIVYFHLLHNFRPIVKKINYINKNALLNSEVHSIPTKVSPVQQGRYLTGSSSRTSRPC